MFYTIVVKNIYVVTVIEDVATTRTQLNNKRALGWYGSLKGARGAVEENKCDMRECLYDYVIIERKASGAYMTSLGEWWYRWDYEKKTYIPIEKPYHLKMFSSFGMG